MSYLVPVSSTQLMFELTKQQVDEIIIDEMKYIYKQNLELEDVEDRNLALMSAIDGILEYYMDKESYSKWLDEIGF